MFEKIQADGPNAEQIRYWNEVAGKTWADLEPKISAQIRPMGEKALAAAAIRTGERVLDVGCGGGETTMALATAVGPGGAVLGVDISQPMLSLAAQAVRDAGFNHVELRLADAQTAELPEAAFDLVFSRFGVMFFADPQAAFKNLFRALRPGGRIAFVCWRSPQENGWMWVPVMAAAAHISFPAFDPHAPGPCALADQARTRRLLETAGFEEVEIAAHEHPMSLGGARSLEEAVEFLLRVGPVSRALRDADPVKIPDVMAALHEALKPHVGEDSVTLGGAAWVVTGHKPA